MTPDEEEVAAALRTTLPGGRDWAHVVRDDAAWPAFSHTFATLLASDFAYEDNILPDQKAAGLEG
jgi:hypothetical protein